MSKFARQELPGGQLKESQWMYFVTRYLSLKAEFGIPFGRNDSYLLQRASAWLHSRWIYEPAFQWGQLPLIGTQARMKLIYSKSKKWPASYYPAIRDYELFLFAAASDITFINHQQPETLKLNSTEVNASIKALTAEGVKAVRSRGEFTRDGGWIFQKGMFSDHADYIFAGNHEVRDDLKEKRIPDIAEDSSHSSRWPLWFRSMISAANESPENRAALLKAYHGYSLQFSRHVVVIKDKSVLLNNFMDGRNGVYRYRYATTGSNEILGHGPYSLSGILGQSWYPFLSGVSTIYSVYENSYPLSKSTVELYVGPNTTRSRNPLFVWPRFFTDGFSQLIAQQSSFLSRCYKLDKTGSPQVVCQQD